MRIQQIAAQTGAGCLAPIGRQPARLCPVGQTQTAAVSHKDRCHAFSESLQAARHVAWAYPVWWGTMPALLKGFLDRVLVCGFAYRYRKDWRTVLQFCGFSPVRITSYGAVRSATPRRIAGWLAAARRRGACAARQLA